MKPVNTTICILLMMTSVCLQLHSQLNYQIRQITPDDVLSQVTILDLLHDQQDLLWIDDHSFQKLTQVGGSVNCFYNISFSIQDLTNTEGLIHWEYNQPELGIRTFGNNNLSERIFRLTYSATFGDKNLKPKRNRETGSQEERSRM